MEHLLVGLYPSPFWVSTEAGEDHISLQFAQDEPITYHAAWARTIHRFRFDWRFVTRPRSRRICAASYFRIESLSGEVTPQWCYAIRFVNMSPGETAEAAISRLLEEELRAQSEEEWGPLKPFTQMETPAVRDFSVDIGEGTVKFSQDFNTGKREYISDPAAGGRLSRVQRDFAGQVAGLVIQRTRPLRGRRPKGPEPEAVAAVFQELLPACTRIVKNLPKKKWPCFNTTLGAKDFVNSHFTGTPEMIEAIAAELRLGDRRPGVKPLTRKVIGRLNRFSAARVRQLTRK